MKVAIVGAGISGLAVAHRLQRAGVPTTLFEKSAVPGGRVATVSQDGFKWDTGATSIAPRGKSIEEVLLTEMPPEGLVRIEKPIYVHEALRISSGEISHSHAPRFTYSNGIAEFALRLGFGADIRFNSQVEDCLLYTSDAADE